MYRILGGADPAEFTGARSHSDIAALMGRLPSNHSPLYAPVAEPTLETGTQALVAAARVWLKPERVA